MMIKDICIATVAYPQAQPYFLDFVEGLKNTQNVNQLTLVVAEQGVTNIVDYLNGIDYEILRIGQDLSIPAVRASLFCYLKNNTNAKYYIFIDIDDRLRSDGLNFHIETLQKADFSYGDQNLYKQNFSAPLYQTLFDTMNAPEKLTSLDDLSNGNCVGLSAFGLKDSTLAHMPENIPDDLIAVDWFIARKLLENGLKGKKTQGCVNDYRLSDPGLGRLMSAKTKEEWKNRAKIALAHFRAVEDETRIKGVQILLNSLEKEPDFILKHAKEVLPQKIFWYEDVSIMALYLCNNKNEVITQ